MRWALPWAATMVGVVPFLWLALTNRKASADWWWLAGAFAVSFVADLAGFAGYGYQASQVYPVTQAGLVALVLLPRQRAVWLIGALLGVAAASIAWRDAQGLDVALRVAAWGSVAVLGFRVPALRLSLGWGFAAMTVAWLAYVWQPGWSSWALLQTARAWTAVAFCVAARRAR